ncbi:hypothetical protein NW760_015222 [Fusarium oxysporum]|nr:hypothetical protein NW769_015122 [Fusarium oxysporum]KAJ4213078.1 hypothetical protein NW760_015222 [Fusarium oxysporum]
MDAFVFITSTGRPGQAESEVDRHRIRRHAMRGMAIARRAKGDYGKHNRRQLPLFLEPTASTVKENTFLPLELFNSALEVAHMVPSPLSAQGYELAKLTFRAPQQSFCPNTSFQPHETTKIGSIAPTFVAGLRPCTACGKQIAPSRRRLYFSSSAPLATSGFGDLRNCGGQALPESPVSAPGSVRG